MYRIPSPLRLYQLVGVYVLVLFAEFLILGLTSISFLDFLLVAVGSAVPFVAVWLAKRTQYSFDEMGIYRRGRLLLDWAEVGSVQVVSLNRSFFHGFGFALMPRNPILVAAVLALPDPASNLREVEYSLAVVVTPRDDGRRLTIPADFDGFMDQVLGQKMQDAISSRRLIADFSFVEQRLCLTAWTRWAMSERVEDHSFLSRRLLESSNGCAASRCGS